MQSTVSTLLLYLDRVIRHFDPDHVGQIKEKHGLPRGLTATAFSPELLLPAITGAITRAQCLGADQLKQDLGELFGDI